MKRIFKTATIMSAIVLASSCNNGTQKTTSDPHAGHDHHATVETPTADSSPAAGTATPTSGTIIIEGDDQMRFNKSEINVKAGEELTFTLKHTGKMGKEVMGHNMVILKPGTDIAAFGLEANKAKDTNYIPASLASSVIAHSDLIGGGEETTFQVTLPEAGRYDFICSFPGHLALMKGVIIAE